MKKLFTLAAAVLFTASMFATALADLNFAGATSLPANYVYSATNTPKIETWQSKSCVLVGNGGTPAYADGIFTTDGFDTSKGKRWMGFKTDAASTLVINCGINNDGRTFAIYKSDGTKLCADKSFAAKNTFEDWNVGTVPAGRYVIVPSGSGTYIYSMTFTAAATYSVTYKAGEGTGDDVVESASIVAGCPNSFTAPSGKVFAGWKNASNEDVAVGATLTADAVLTAQWVTPVAPTVVFADGVYYIEGQDLDLSSLFTSNSEGAVTYAVVNDDASTGALIDGKKFKATSAGVVEVSATQAESGIYSGAVVTAKIAVKAALDELVIISTAYTFEPSATIPVSTLAEGNKLFTAGDSECDYTSDGMRIKENRSLAFKVADGAKVKVTFKTNGSREMKLGTAMTGDASKVYGHSSSSPVEFNVTTGGVVYLTSTSDLRFSKLEVSYTSTAIDNTEAEVKTVKTFENGQLIIIKNGVKYNAQGAVVR